MYVKSNKKNKDTNKLSIINKIVLETFFIDVLLLNK